MHLSFGVQQIVRLNGMKVPPAPPLDVAVQLSAVKLPAAMLLTVPG